jgi:glycerophosphoryl diester phosphodiesterase
MNDDPPSARRPAVVAHRGASHLAAEHTLAAYVAAINIGADALECDVRLTRDGHLVCVHDRTVNRTSDGKGAVSTYDLAELERLDFTSWRSAPDLDIAPSRDDDGRVLTLDRLLGLVRDADRPVRLLVETKHPTRFAGLVEEELVRTLIRFGVVSRVEGLTRRSTTPLGGDPMAWGPVVRTAPVTVMSFAPTALRRVRQLTPQLPTVLLMQRLTLGRRDAVLPPGVGIAGPALRLLKAHPEYVDQVHKRGSLVYVWTVDDEPDIDYVIGLGVDAIISNRPETVLQRMPGA